MCIRDSNKIDRIGSVERDALERRTRALEPTPAVFVSAHELESLESLKETLRARMRQRLTSVVISIPVVDGEAIATVYREGEVVGRADQALDVHLTARLPHRVLGKLTTRDGVKIVEVA